MTVGKKQAGKGAVPRGRSALSGASAGLSTGQLSLRDHDPASVEPAFAPALIAWQRQHGRHDLPWQNTRDPYRIWLSEIMLQQTQVASVIPYYQRFLQKFPDNATLAAAAQEEVLVLWAGLGRYAELWSRDRWTKAIETTEEERAALGAKLSELGL